MGRRRHLLPEAWFVPSRPGPQPRRSGTTICLNNLPGPLDPTAGSDAASGRVAPGQLLDAPFATLNCQVVNPFDSVSWTSPSALFLRWSGRFC